MNAGQGVPVASVVQTIQHWQARHSTKKPRKCLSEICVQIECRAKCTGWLWRRSSSKGDGLRSSSKGEGTSKAAEGLRSSKLKQKHKQRMASKLKQQITLMLMTLTAITLITLMIRVIRSPWLLHRQLLMWQRNADFLFGLSHSSWPSLGPSLELSLVHSLRPGLKLSLMLSLRPSLGPSLKPSLA